MKKNSETFTKQTPAVAAELGVSSLMVVTRVFTVLSLELCQARTMQSYFHRETKEILMIMND